jgi:hypothetical protein
MRIVLLILVSLTAGLSGSGTARADQYKWCANMGGGNDGGMMNCYFVTLQQCQAYVQGIGGFCMPSPFDGNRPAASWGQVQAQPEPQSRKR